VRVIVAVLLALAACEEDEPRVDVDAGSESCRDLFGAAPLFTACAEEADRCSFYTRGAALTCDAICGDLGAACAESYPAENGCAPSGAATNCVVPNPAQICVCLRP
jgi:hypothetical protein